METLGPPQTVPRVRAVVAELDPKPIGVLITYAAIPPFGPDQAFLAGSCWTFLYEPVPRRQRIEYRLAGYGPLILDEFVLELEEAYAALEGFMTRNGQLQGLTFGAPLSSGTVLHDLRAPTVLPTFTQWPERHLHVEFEGVGQPPMILFRQITHETAPHFANGNEAVAEWVWRSTASRGTPAPGGSQRSSLVVVIPDRRGRLGALGELQWEAGRSALEIPVETGRSSREHLILKVAFLPKRESRPVPAPGARHREPVPARTAAIKVTLESGDSVLDVRDLPYYPTTMERPLFFPRVNEAPSLAPAGTLGPARPFGLDRHIFGDELCLGVERYAEALATVLAESRGEVSLAFFGPWGRGKTRLAELVQAALPPWYDTVHFSAWRYRSAPETWAFFYETLLRRSLSLGALRAPEALGRVARMRIERVGFWHLLAALLVLAVGLLPATVLLEPFLLHLIGLFGLLGAWWCLRSYRVLRSAGWITRLLAPARYQDSLGAQAAIGEDLTALVTGWVPVPAYARGDVWTLWWSRSWRALALTPGVLLVCASVAYGLAGDRQWVVTLASHQLAAVPAHAPTWLAAIVVLVFGLAGLLPLLCAVRSVFATRRVLIIVDDLDRLPPDQCLTVIESIKLLLEEPEIGSRVQLIALVELDVLAQGIGLKYSTQPDVRAVRDTIEKLFVGHVQLKPLVRAEVAEIVERFTERRGAAAEVLRQQVQAEERTPPIRLTKEGPESTRLDTAISAGHVRLSVDHDAVARSKAALAEAQRRILSRPAPRSTSAGGEAPSPLDFTPDERAALSQALQEAADRWKSAPTFRTVQNALFRFQLAKLLIARPGEDPVGADPVRLARALVLGELDGVTDEERSIAEVLSIRWEKGIKPSHGHSGRPSVTGWQYEEPEPFAM